MSIEDRAGLHNPNHLCSFNSLTQCIYNCHGLRNIILSYDENDPNQKPLLHQDPVLTDLVLNNRLNKTLFYEKNVVQFCILYKEIFKSFETEKQLSLAKCTEYLIDTTGNAILKNGPTDPMIEFSNLILLYSGGQRVMFFPQLTPYTNPLVKELLVFYQSPNGPLRTMFLSASNRSKIFDFQFDEYLYDYTSQRNPMNLIMIQSMSDYLLIKYENDTENIGRVTVQATLDFTKYVADTSQSNIYLLNSFIVLLSEIHAVAYVREMKFAKIKPEEANEMWYIYNDTDHRKLSWSELNSDLQRCGPTKHICMAFYQRANMNKRNIKD